MSKRKGQEQAGARDAGDSALWDRVKRSIDPLDPRHRDLYSQAMADYLGRDRQAARDKTPAPSRKPDHAPTNPPPTRIPDRRPPALPAYTPASPTPAAAPPLVELDRKSRSRIARGRTPIDARLDLHGLRQHEAHDVLRGFIWRAYAAGHRTVLVITGKGLRQRAPHADAPPWAEGSGVLRKAVPGWLAASDLRPLVLGVEPAHANHGGEGALYVRLRSRRQTP